MMLHLIKITTNHRKTTFILIKLYLLEKLTFKMDRIRLRKKALKIASKREKFLQAYFKIGRMK